MGQKGGCMRVGLEYDWLGNKHETVQAYEFDARCFATSGDTAGAVMDPQYIT